MIGQAVVKGQDRAERGLERFENWSPESFNCKSSGMGTGMASKQLVTGHRHADNLV
jgi:hypothetical protein